MSRFQKEHLFLCILQQFLFPLQLKFDKTEFKSIINIDTDTVYGAVINTTDGTTYGLCHQENIWKGYELAWSTGYTTESNGCHLNSEHFESMIGKTIDSVTYYASNGIYTLILQM